MSLCPFFVLRLSTDIYVCAQAFTARTFLLERLHAATVDEERLSTDPL